MAKEPQIQLVDMEESHAKGYADILSDPSTWHFLTDSGPKNEDEALAKIRKNILVSQEGSAHYWSILTGANEFAGFIAVHNLREKGVAISYGIRPGFRRKGIASAALQEVLNWKGIRGKRVSMATHEENVASFNMLQKLGLTYEGLVETRMGKRHVFRWEKHISL